MNILDWNNLTEDQQKRALTRPAVADGSAIQQTVTSVIEAVKNIGDQALREFSAQYDQVKLTTIAIEDQAVEAASQRLDQAFKDALKNAVDNIESFHRAQIPQPVRVETQPGVICEQFSIGLDSIGLYIPGGSAPLPSTVLMLAIPARIAGCSKVVLCSPPPIADEILYAAHYCGIREIYQVGGAQAVAAMAYGTETVCKVDKIFGPGNAYVTAAKQLVSQDINGAAIDMPAGPSEILVIADQNANPAFVASDLLSQAEHGPDSQTILATPSQELAEAVAREVDYQIKLLPRGEIASIALTHSRLIVTTTLDQAIEVSNNYGPEHLIVQTDNARELLPRLKHAGSIFLGAWTPESAGDYASGTNHVLPTYGYTRTYSSLGLADFMKRFTVQEITREGLQELGPVITTLADAEQLTAHGNAVRLRLAKLEGC